MLPAVSLHLFYLLLNLLVLVLNFLKLVLHLFGSHFRVKRPFFRFQVVQPLLVHFVLTLASGFEAPHQRVELFDLVAGGLSDLVAAIF